PTFEAAPDTLPPSPALVDLLVRLLEKNPRNRISLREAASHAWTISDLDESGRRAWEARVGRWFVVPHPIVLRDQWPPKGPE
ncbi:hypothetical protein HDU93_004064, partial [Gonapodya sp. JEL0774]